jgi:hypothetical protein
MHVVLQAIEGPAVGVRISVRPGQVVQVGRTRWADICIERDPALADVHFALDYAGRKCHIRALDTGRGIAVNEVQVGESALAAGDRVTAGQTTFAVTLEGDEAFAALTTAAADADQEQDQEPAAPAPTAAVYCSYLEISDAAFGLLEDDPPPDEYADRLIDAELFGDALLFLAFWSPKSAAVAWGCRWVEKVFSEFLSDAGLQALDSARQWADQPDEARRRAAGRAAEVVEYDGAPGFVAAAAFWSGGSIAPADLPEVRPGEALTARAVAAALTMCAHDGDPTKTPDRYRAILNDIPRPTSPTLPPPAVDQA